MESTRSPSSEWLHYKDSEIFFTIQVVYELFYVYLCTDALECVLLVCVYVPPYYHPKGTTFFFTYTNKVINIGVLKNKSLRASTWNTCGTIGKMMGVRGLLLCGELWEYPLGTYKKSY